MPIHVLSLTIFVKAKQACLSTHYAIKRLGENSRIQCGRVDLPVESTESSGLNDADGISRAEILLSEFERLIGGKKLRNLKLLISH